MQEAFREEIRRHKKDIDYDNPRCGEFFWWYDFFVLIRDRIDSYLIEMKEGKEKEFHEEQLIMIGLDLMGAGADVSQWREGGSGLGAHLNQLSTNFPSRQHLQLCSGFFSSFRSTRLYNRGATRRWGCWIVSSIHFKWNQLESRHKWKCLLKRIDLQKKLIFSWYFASFIATSHSWTSIRFWH